MGIWRLSHRKPEGSLYFLHGSHADDRQAVDIGLLSFVDSRLLQRLRDRAIQIVLPDIRSTLLRESAGAGTPSYSRYFIEEVMPKAEEGTETRPETRNLAGWSMGGQAALSQFLRRPELFAGVGAHFPTLVDFNYTDETDSAEYAARARVAQDRLTILRDDLRGAFPRFEDFRAHNPTDLAASVARRSDEALRGKTIYFDVGSEDEFGLHEGCERFSRALTSLGIHHSYTCAKGGRHDGPFVASRIDSLIETLYPA